MLTDRFYVHSLYFLFGAFLGFIITCVWGLYLS